MWENFIKIWESEYLCELLEKKKDWCLSKIKNTQMHGRKTIVDFLGWCFEGSGNVFAILGWLEFKKNS